MMPVPMQITVMDLSWNFNNNLMKNILTTISTAIVIFSNAQVGIGTQNPNATLDIKAVKVDGTTAEGMLLPRMSGNEIKNAGNQYQTDQTGTIIYATSKPVTTDAKTVNITKNGYYFFDGTVWKSMGPVINNTIVSYSTVVDPNILGYIPSKTATATAAPATYPIGSNTYTKNGNITFSVNSHSYTVYTGTNSVTWFEAYNAAKAMGGYLATFTTDAEWQFVETNLLTNNTLFDNERAWMGFVKYSWNAGPALMPDPEAKWISGELPLHNYSAGGNASVRKSNWFAPDEPNNYTTGEGFVHTWNKNYNLSKTVNNYTSTHLWNDFTSNDSTVKCFLVEFQQ